MKTLTADEIDAFQEIANIGGGQAASHLANLLSRPCRVSVPQVLYDNSEAIKRSLDVPESFAVGLRLEILGDIPAEMLVIMRRMHAMAVVRWMTQCETTVSGKIMDFTSEFALKQLAELLTQSFAIAVGNFLSAKPRFAMPQIFSESWSTVLGRFLDGADSAGNNVVIYSDFFDEGRTFEGRFVYLLRTDSQKLVLDRVNQLLG